MKQTTVTLNDGNTIPQFGIGVYQVRGNALTKRVCLEALKNGYRHIDTAHAYRNEAGVGEAVRESGIPREEIMLTTKLWINDYSKNNAAASIDNRLKQLNVDYIDLLLIHQQHGKYLEAWREMEKAVRAGKVRSIGLSNFESPRLEEVLEAAEIKPAVLQVECHPYFQQRELKKRIAPYGTALESWYPIGHGNRELIDNPLFVKLAEKYHKNAVQIILRWHIQEGNIVFPKSEDPAHIKSNINIFDFALTDEEMNEIRMIDRNTRFYEPANMPLEKQEAMMSGWEVPD